MISLAIPLLALALAGAPVEEDHPAEEDRPYRGIGLIVGASVAGVASIAMTSVRVDLEYWDCPISSHDSDPQRSSSYDADYCKTDTIRGMMVPNILANLTAVALAPAAGVVRGRYDAWRFRTTGEPRRRHRVIIGIGAGLVAVAVPTVMLGPLFGSSTDDSPALIITLAQLGTSAFGGGLGLWTYGITYSANARRPSPRVTLLPQLAPDRFGFTLASRF